MPDPDDKPDTKPDDKPDTKPGDGDKPDHQAEAEKWKSLARKHEAQAKANADAARKLAELEDAGKSETERLTAAVAEAERKAQEADARALRLEVAAEKGLTAKQAKFLSGSSREDLESLADELISSFKSEDNGKPPPTDKPRERLRGGGDPTEEPDGETDPRKLAAQVPRPGF